MNAATVDPGIPPAWQRDVESREKGEAWKTPLLLNGRGDPKTCGFNVCVVLQHHPDLAGRLRFNELAHAVECTSLPWKACQGWRRWTDTDDTMLSNWCQYHGMMVRPVVCAEAVQAHADQHRYHPIRDYLDKLVWDGVKRLDRWLETYLGATVEPGREEYLRQISRKSPIQCVARICDPGCKADHMPVFQGGQGIGKSTAIRILAKEEAWFADEIADLGSKDAAQDLAGKWIIEVPELAAIRGREVERVKAFVSRRVDHYRPSYGRRSQDHPRQCVFFGTTNSDAYLQDETGNRRFWPITVTRIDLAALRRDVDQIWAEAVIAYRAREGWWLDAEAERLAVEVQAERRIEDVWEKPLLEWAGRQLQPFTVGDALTGAINLPIERHDRSAQMRVAGVLKANGYKRKKVYPPAPAKPFNAYVRDEPPPDDGPGSGEVGMCPDEVGMQPEAAEVGISQPQTGSGNEVGMLQTIAAPAVSQPSQPSQPFSRTYEKGAGERVRRSNGSRLGGRDGWDVDQPHWANADGWRKRLAAARGPEQRRETLAAWAEAAGCRLGGDVLQLRPGLPNRVTTDEMAALARELGVEVQGATA
jgi:predicted P-loop ATPase